MTKIFFFAHFLKIILFDSHSVIDIHGLTTLTSTKNDLFKKKVTCHRYTDIKERSKTFIKTRTLAINNLINSDIFYM